MSHFTLEPTVFPAANFVAGDDAKALRAAMKGLGTNQGVILNILTKRSNEQRQEIRTAFKNEVGKDLVKDLKGELGGKFEDLIVALMKTPQVYLANELHRAMDRLGTDESALTTILITNTTKDVEKIKTAYQEKQGKSLESALKSDLSGNYKKLLQLLISNGRNEGLVHPLLAQEMAEKLFTAGEGQWGTNEDTFLKILSHQSFKQIRLIREEYQKLSGHSLEEAVKKEFSGDVFEAISTILKITENQGKYFAEELERAMKGIGCDDVTLIRIIVSRSEIDLGWVKREYKMKYNKNLYDAVQSETSGDYKAALLNLIGIL